MLSFILGNIEGAILIIVATASSLGVVCYTLAVYASWLDKSRYEERKKRLEEKEKYIEYTPFISNGEREKKLSEVVMEKEAKKHLMESFRENMTRYACYALICVTIVCISICTYIAEARSDLSAHEPPLQAVETLDGLPPSVSTADEEETRRVTVADTPSSSEYVYVYKKGEKGLTKVNSWKTVNCPDSISLAAGVVIMFVIIMINYIITLTLI